MLSVEWFPARSHMNGENYVASDAWIPPTSSHSQIFWKLYGLRTGSIVWAGDPALHELQVLGIFICSPKYFPVLPYCLTKCMSVPRREVLSNISSGIMLGKVKIFILIRVWHCEKCMERVEELAGVHLFNYYERNRFKIRTKHHARISTGIINRRPFCWTWMKLKNFLGL